MLEKVDLTRAIPKEEYKTRLPALQASLYDLQLRTSEAGLPSVIVFEGWEAAGKGTCINVLTSRLEPRDTQGRIQDPPAGVAGESLRSAASHVGGGPCI